MAQLKLSVPDSRGLPTAAVTAGAEHCWSAQADHCLGFGEPGFCFLAHDCAGSFLKLVFSSSKKTSPFMRDL